MHEVRFAPAALRDLQRLREFLQPKNPVAARRAGEVIVKALQLLGAQPRLGRPIEGLPDEFREWIIDFGDSGYVARYHVEADTVIILALRHQREAGF